jgi:hypothetical protein
MPLAGGAGERHPDLREICKVLNLRRKRCKTTAHFEFFQAAYAGFLPVLCRIIDYPLAFSSLLVYSKSKLEGGFYMNTKWSRKKIYDEFTTMRKADGTPMSRQQIHMLRKRAQGICLTCSEPAIGVYCLKHTIVARERMRQKLHYRRRLRTSPSYILEKQARSKRRAVRLRSGLRHAMPASLHPAARMPRSKARARAAAMKA